jgi:hypothetical protein
MELQHISGQSTLRAVCHCTDPALAEHCLDRLRVSMDD